MLCRVPFMYPFLIINFGPDFKNSFFFRLNHYLFISLRDLFLCFAPRLLRFTPSRFGSFITSFSCHTSLMLRIRQYFFFRIRIRAEP
jgi:hypothetical protein